MKIVDNRKSNDVKFEDLKNGDTFLHAGTYYIKAYYNDFTNADNYKNAFGGRASAIDLGDGIIVEFNNNEYVTPLNGHFVIE